MMNVMNVMDVYYKKRLILVMEAAGWLAWRESESVYAMEENGCDRLERPNSTSLIGVTATSP